MSVRHVYILALFTKTNPPSDPLNRTTVCPKSMIFKNLRFLCFFVCGTCIMDTGVNKLHHEELKFDKLHVYGSKPLEPDDLRALLRPGGRHRSGRQVGAFFCRNLGPPGPSGGGWCARLWIVGI